MTRRRLNYGHWLVRAVIAVLAIAMVAGAAIVLRASQESAHRGVAQRFAARSGLAASFVNTYVSQLSTREEVVATATLAGADPTAAFNAEVQSFGFPAAVLLDSDGRALAVVPPAPAVLGKQLSLTYAHLASAVKGQRAVSNVVKSAAAGDPVVGFAVPFSTPSGLRVFSGAYAVSETPLVAFLEDTISLKGAQLYLTDSTGVVVASNGVESLSGRALSVANPMFSQAVAKAKNGTYRSNDTSFTFTTAAVAGTPWTLLIAAPTDRLFASTDGTAHWLPWVILGALSILIGIAGWLSIRLLAGRRRLADINTQLEALSRTDMLTGLANRRHVTEQLAIQLANSRRHGFPLTVLMIDIDHFKLVNDTYGHQRGDEVLRNAARQLGMSLREGDLLARWGGEEFLAVLPFTDAAHGTEVALRLCKELSTTPICVGEDIDPLMIGVSIGVAEAGDGTLDALIHRADLGLYEAKRAGRNTVRTAGPVPQQALSEAAK